MASPSNPWLSVILPVRQGAAFLGAALESVAAQTFRLPLEVIALDDGSDDGSVEILEAFRDRLHLRLERDLHLGNWVASTNLGLSLARGRYASILHQDDTWLPQRLARLQALTEAHPEAGFFLHAARFVDRSGRHLGNWTAPLPRQRRPLAPHEVLPRYAAQNFIAMPAPLFSMDLARRVGPLDESLWFTADWDFWRRLIGCGPMVYEPTVLACFRLHAGSQTERGSHDAMDLYRQVRGVSQRVLAMEAIAPTRRAALDREAELSARVTAALAALAHGEKAPLCPLAAAWRAGPAGCLRFLRDSRLRQRLWPRLRLRLRGGGNRT